MTLNETCRMITGCLKPTDTNSLPVFAGIAPSDIRRAVASRTERTRQTTDQMHPLNGHLGVVPRLKSRKSFIKCTEPINTTSKAARLELWRERFEPCQLAQIIPGQPGRHSTGCVGRSRADHATHTGLPHDGHCLLSPIPGNG